MFDRFLAGETLQQCYAAVAAVANRWLDMLDTQVLWGMEGRSIYNTRWGSSYGTKRGLAGLAVHESV